MATPTWLAATAGQVGRPGQINQFLDTHTSQWVYTGNLAVQQATGAALYQSTAAQYLAQTFITGSSQTAIGRLALQISTVGGSPVTATITPLTVSLYASQFGLPTGSAITTVSLAEPYVYSQPFWVSVPMFVTGLTASTPYWIVVGIAGTGSAYYVWQESNQTAGAATSTDGVTFTATAYGLMYQVYDTTGGGQVLGMVDDGGARTVTFTYTGASLTGLTEYTQAQGGTTLVSTRTFTYSGGFLIGVS